MLLDIAKFRSEMDLLHETSSKLFNFHYEYSQKHLPAMHPDSRLALQRADRFVKFVDEFFYRVKISLKTFEDRYNEVIDKLLVEEQIDVVEKENKESALRHWRKTPFVSRNYEPLEQYEIINSLDPQEKDEIHQKLLDNDHSMSKTMAEKLHVKDEEASSCVIPGDINEEDFHATVEFLTKKKQRKRNHEDDKWEACLLGKDVEERETWGIDC